MENSELKEIVEIIVKDPHAISNWRSICGALDLQSAEFEWIPSSLQIPIKDLFKSILERWRSENGEKANKENLETVFRNETFNYIAGCKLNDSKHESKPIKFPLRHNYEGIVANFVSRHAFEEEIIEYLTNGQNLVCSVDFPIVVLHGIGGVGKTTLARRICQLTLDSNEVGSELKYFQQNCIWIQAEKEELVIKDFSKLFGIQAKNQEAIKEYLIAFYTQQLIIRPCLIVFDNVDDFEMILNYLPLNLNSKVAVLITSNIEWDSGDLGKVQNIKIQYFTVKEFSIFVREIIPYVTFCEIKYLDEYTGRIPYLANVACRGFAKWRKHRPIEKIDKYFQDKENLLENGIKLGLSSQKYKLRPQEIVERQINLMRKHEGEDGDLAYELLCYLSYCKPEFKKSLLLKLKMENIDVAISILVEHGFLKKDYEEKEKKESEKYMSIHRSYQKAVRIIPSQEGKEEELFVKVIGMLDESYGFCYWNLALLWETGIKLGDPVIEKMTHSFKIMKWVTATNFWSNNNICKTLIEYLKRTKPKKGNLKLSFFLEEMEWGQIYLHKDIDDNDFTMFIKDLKSFKDKLGWMHFQKFVFRVVFRKQKWLEQIYETFPEKFKENQERNSFLIHAVILKKLEAVKFFIAKGFNVNQKDTSAFFGNTPLLAANKLEIVEELLKHGADPNLISNMIRWTPLHKAALVGDLDKVKLLLSYEADPDLKDMFRNTALNYATDMCKIRLNDSDPISSSEEIIKLLKERDVQLN